MCGCGREPRAVVVEGKGHKEKRAMCEGWRIGRQWETSLSFFPEKISHY